MDLESLETRVKLLNSRLKQYTAYRPEGFYTKETSLRFSLWWTGEAIVLNWLKHGHMWMNSNKFDGGFYNLVLASDGDVEYTVGQDFGNADEVLKKFLSGDYSLVVITRDPVRYIFSGLSQAILGSQHNVKYAEGFKEFDSESFEALKLIHHDKWFLEGYLSNSDVNNYSDRINILIKKYIKYCIDNWQHIVLSDTHVSNRISLVYKILIDKYDGDDITFIDIGNIDKEQRIVDYLYSKKLLEKKENLPPDSSERHSNRSIARLIREVFRETSLNESLPYFLRIEREIEDYIILRNKYTNLWI